MSSPWLQKKGIYDALTPSSVLSLDAWWLQVGVRQLQQAADRLITQSTCSQRSQVSQRARLRGPGSRCPVHPCWARQRGPAACLCISPCCTTPLSQFASLAPRWAAFLPHVKLVTMSRVQGAHACASAPVALPLRPNSHTSHPDRLPFCLV